MEEGKYILWQKNHSGDWEIYMRTDDLEEAQEEYNNALIITGCYEDELIFTEDKTALVEKKIVVPNTLWHDCITSDLYPFDDSRADCVPTSWAVSYLLDDIGVKHDCVVGTVYSKTMRRTINPHVWIVLDDGWFIDIRLRMWFGDNEFIPHGVFHPDNESDLVFNIEESLLKPPSMRWEREFVDMESNFIMNKVHLTSRW